METVTSNPCPACGSMLMDTGVCTNQQCPALEDDSGGQWEATSSEDKIMKTKRGWEETIGFEVPVEGFKEEGKYDPLVLYTRDDFERKAGIS